MLNTLQPKLNYYIHFSGSDTYKAYVTEHIKFSKFKYNDIEDFSVKRLSKYMYLHVPMEEFDLAFDTRLKCCRLHGEMFLNLKDINKTNFCRKSGFIDIFIKNKDKKVLNLYLRFDKYVK